MTLAVHGDTREAFDSPLTIKPGYLEALSLVERLHPQLLDVIKDELERRGELEANSVQALMLFHIGDQELTAGELRTRGHYLRSNVSHRLKKLVEFGYIHRERSDADRREGSAFGWRKKGQAIRRLVASLFDRRLTSLHPVGNLAPEDFPTMNPLAAPVGAFLAGSGPLPAVDENRSQLLARISAFKNLYAHQSAIGLCSAPTVV